MVVRRRLSTSLTLPTEFNEPPTEFDDQCSLWFGRKSWGKTTLLSQYKNSLVMVLEPGRRNLHIKQVPKEGEAISWELVNQYIDLFIESDLHVLCIDTVDRFYQLGLAWLTSSLSNGGFDDPQRSPIKDNIPGFYVSFQKVYEEVLERIRAAGKIWVLTSHDRKVTTKHPITGDKEERIEPSCSPSAWKIAQSMCDYVFHLEFYKGQRVVTVRDIDNIALACCGRDDVFLNPDGSKISRFAVPSNPQEVYSTILKAYNNELEDIQYVGEVKTLAKKSTLKMVTKRTTLPKRNGLLKKK